MRFVFNYSSFCFSFRLCLDKLLKFVSRENIVNQWLINILGIFCFINDSLLKEPHPKLTRKHNHDKFEYKDKCEKSTAISNNLTTAIGYVDWILLVEDVQKVASLPSHFRLFSFVLTMANNAEWITSVHLHKTRRRRRRKQLCDVGRCLSKGQRDGRTFGRRPRIQREGGREVGRGANLAGFSY